jgi:hypothetical protein
MTYVHVPVATSQNAQRLANDLSRVIDDHKRDHPGLSPADIRQALQIAGAGVGAGRTRQLVVAIAAGLLLLVGLLTFFLVQRG